MLWQPRNIFSSRRLPSPKRTRSEQPVSQKVWESGCGAMYKQANKQARLLPCTIQTRNHNRVPTVGSTVGYSQIIWAQGARAGEWGPAFFRVHAPDGVPPRGTQTTHSTPCHIEASSAGGEIWVAAFEGATSTDFAPKFGTSLWHHGHTDTRTHRQTNRKLAPPAKRGCGKYGRTRYFNAGG